MADTLGLTPQDNPALWRKLNAFCADYALDDKPALI